MFCLSCLWASFKLMLCECARHFVALVAFSSFSTKPHICLFRASDCFAPFWFYNSQSATSIHLASRTFCHASNPHPSLVRIHCSVDFKGLSSILVVQITCLLCHCAVQLDWRAFIDYLPSLDSPIFQDSPSRSTSELRLSLEYFSSTLTLFSLWNPRIIYSIFHRRHISYISHYALFERFIKLHKNINLEFLSEKYCHHLRVGSRRHKDRSRSTNLTLGTGKTLPLLLRLQLNSESTNFYLQYLVFISSPRLVIRFCFSNIHHSFRLWTHPLPLDSHVTWRFLKSRNNIRPGTTNISWELRQFDQANQITLKKRCQRESLVVPSCLNQSANA